MAVFCLRLLPRGFEKAGRVVNRGILGKAYSKTSMWNDVRRGTSYFNEIFPLDRQTIIKDGAERIRVIRKNKEQYLPTQLFSDVTTVCEGFQRGMRVSNDGPLLGFRKGPDELYQWMTFSEVDEKARHLGSGLVAMGISPGNESFVGISASNKPKWTISDMACVYYSMVSVPLYASLGADSLRHIANQTNMSVLICDTAQKVETVLESSAAITTLRTVVIMDVPSEGVNDIKRRCEAVGLTLLTFDEVIAKGESYPCDPVFPKPTDLNTIVYTSGTTGVPKGVPITHRQYIVNHAVIHSAFNLDFHVCPDDIHISYMPLAHVFERANLYHCMFHGAQIGFYSGNLLNLIDDVKALRPTFFFGVPRVYNRVYNQVMINLKNSSPAKRTVFNFAYQQKLKGMQRGILRNDSLWDTLVFKKVQELFGGRIRVLFSGAAPLSEEVATFFRVAMGCPFIEGYGQTETTSCISHTIDTDMTSGHVGIPGSDMEIKLIDVPELNYFAKDDLGEVCVKGGNVFSGYFKDPDKTKEMLDEGGWLHTGDIGRWNQNGTLSIIDRKKQILKLSQGMYVAPEKVENVYIRLPVLVQIFVYGDSLKPFVVGIVVPDPQELEKVGKSVGVTGSLKELCQNKNVKDSVLQSLRKHGKKEGLQGFEQVQAIHLTPEPFSEQNGLLTPTLKAKRTEITKAFYDEIEQLYRSNQAL